MTTRFDVLLRSEQSGDALAVTENTVPAGWAARRSTITTSTRRSTCSTES